MAALQDKTNEVHVEDLSREHAVGQVTEDIINSGGLTEALRGRKTNWLAPSIFQLYLIMFVGYMVSTFNGYGMLYQLSHSLRDISRRGPLLTCSPSDGSLMGAINGIFDSLFL